jgi:hypothetical protein
MKQQFTGKHTVHVHTAQLKYDDDAVNIYIEVLYLLWLYDFIVQTKNLLLSWEYY